jgi:hypothetical protein
LPIAKEYLAAAATTLRTSVQHRGQAIVYTDDKQAGALSHTTLWRWLTWLGAMTVSLAVGNELFMQSHPSSSVHRFEGLVDPRKARSPSRLQSLSIARRLLYLQSRWDEAFAPEVFFPRFATACRPP